MIVKSDYMDRALGSKFRSGAGQVGRVHLIFLIWMSHKQDVKHLYLYICICILGTKAVPGSCRPNSLDIPKQMVMTKT